MPKERVVDAGAIEHLSVVVKWGREQHYVQVASVGEVAPKDTGFGEQGWFVTLDRPGINDLIRYLRKARDQAFGRDE